MALGNHLKTEIWSWLFLPPSASNLTSVLGLEGLVYTSLLCNFNNRYLGITSQYLLFELI